MTPPPPVTPTPPQAVPQEGDAIDIAMLLRPRFPGCCGESDSVCRPGLALAWQAGRPSSLPARRSRKLLPKPEALQVADLGQSPVGEKGLPRGSKCRSDRSRGCQEGLQDWLAAPHRGGREFLAWPGARDSPVSWQCFISFIPEWRTGLVLWSVRNMIPARQSGKGLPVSSQVVFIGIGTLFRKKRGFQRQVELQVPTMPFT